MDKRQKCIHNNARNPELGVVCKLRDPDTLCKDCKWFEKKESGTSGYKGNIYPLERDSSTDNTNWWHGW